MDPKMEALLRKAYENLQAKPKKKTKKAKKSPTTSEKEPTKVRETKCLSLDDVDQAYSFTGLKPMQDQIFFVEGDSRMHAGKVSEDNNSATPIGALVTQKKRNINPDEETIFTRLFDECSDHWSLGSVAQLLGYSCSYIQGFQGGFNDYATPHPNCSLDAHKGYADGQAILGTYRDRGLIALKDGDPFEDEDNIAILKELTRCTGYWREEWGDYLIWPGARLLFIDDLAEEEEEEEELEEEELEEAEEVMEEDEIGSYA